MAIDKDAARAHLSACGVDFSADFHALPSDQVQALTDYAKAHGYRKPKNANGSTGRYFFAMLTRNRYESEFIVQANYGYGQGWEDVSSETTPREGRIRLREYDENESAPHRLITRRVLKPYA